MHALAQSNRRARTSRDERDALILQYRPYVRKVARTLARALPRSVELDELIGWGDLGLVEAAERFDAARGVTFRTFAHHRIRGAILDGLRREPGAARSRTGRDLAGDGAGADGDAAASDRALAPSASPERLAYLAELRAELERASSGLSPLERALLTHHYVDGQPVERLAKQLNLSKSWLSRVHGRALAKIRAQVTIDAWRSA